MQTAASAGDSVTVQYVCMDFLPNRGSSHRQTEEEDNHGYSTINPRAIQEGPDTRELNTDLEEQGEYNSRSRSGDGGEPCGARDSGTVSPPVHLTRLNSAKVIAMTSESEVHFDVEIAIKVLRQAGYYSHAVFLAEKHTHHEWYLKIQLEDLKNYQEALRYIGRLPFEQAESNMKRYGKTLMHHVPEETTRLLKGLCTDYRPSRETPADRESLGHTLGNKANSEEFIAIFVNNPRELRAFLEHMMDVEAQSPQGEKNSLQEAVLSLLKSENYSTVFDKALVLCQMHNFKEGVLYLYEQGQLTTAQCLTRRWCSARCTTSKKGSCTCMSKASCKYPALWAQVCSWVALRFTLQSRRGQYQQIMHYHMQNEEYGKVVEACQRYGEKEACLWEQALGYFARKEEDCKEYITAVLQHIDRNNLMPPLLVVQTLAHNSTATLSVIKDYLINKLQQESEQISEDERKIREYRVETTQLRQEIEELRSSAKIFQKTKCSMCNSPLELPSVHFLCSHSFHQHCFESYAESEAECPTCAPDNRKVMDMLRAQDQKRDLHEHFHRQLKCSNDGFSVVADYFGRGVFNKLTLITDPPGGKVGAASLDSDLQRDLLIHTKRTV
ncbi:Vacuolar protein sorting-associated protein 11-like [Acipenser ruthenus]|uniref:Vacuolar protein sorting-associated protein 11-like n=1 Tax=Acipenser ruthenus TaxID=7906 RepID=A0A444UWP3_ACIRT|nr:Vacuolar protein sorting-associated protein 11-like [Acipenser ruthenus]